MPLPIPQLTNRQIARFNASVIRRDSGCWEWSRRRMRKGYGTFSAFGREYRAHRIAYALHSGRDPGDSLVCHRCDNPPCVNPEHLWLGNAQANSSDMVTKGRARFNTPETHGHIYQTAGYIARAKRGRESAGAPEYCQTCGHHRTDDYIERTGKRPGNHRCKACHDRRTKLRRARAKQSNHDL